LYSGESHTMAFTYGRLGGVEAITHTLPDGKQVSETPLFDEEGVLRNSTYTLGNTEIASLSFGVDDTGRRSWAHVGSLVRSFDYDQNHRLVRDRVHALTPGNNSSNNSHGAGPVNTATGLNDAGSTGSSQHQDEYHAVGVIDRVFTWRADDIITQITDQIRGVETSYDVDPMGRVTRVTHQHAMQNMPQTREKRAGREELYSYSQAGVLTKLHPDTTTRWADDVDSYGGTMPYQVGRTRFTYDKAGRVTQTVMKRLSKKPLVKHFYYESGTQPVGYEDSDHPGVGWRYLYDGACRRVGKEQINTTTGEVTSRVMFLHEGDVLFGEYHTVNVMDPHMVGSAVLWPTDPGTGEILGQITINTTDSTAYRHDGNGYYPGGNGGGSGADNSVGYPYNQHNDSHNNDPYNHDGSYDHNDSTTGDGSGGVLGWPQQRVDAVFYSMVCDLAGAPKELINPATGEVVGYATYTLFGKRHWAGMVSTPLLFTGQYEDTESGWVYNRFRYYDPHAGVYNAQDPLGLLANLGTAQGYVTNPVTWVDALGLKGCSRKITPALRLKIMDNLHAIAHSEGDRIMKWYEGHTALNVAAMLTKDVKIYYASGATGDLLKPLPKGVEGMIIKSADAPYITETGEVIPNATLAMSRKARRPFHAERILDRYARQNGLEPVEFYSEIEFCGIPSIKGKPYLPGSCAEYFFKQGYVELSPFTFSKLNVPKT